MTIEFTTVLYGVLVLFLSWTGWNSLEVIKLDKKSSSTEQWQSNTSESISESNQKIDKLSDDITQEKVDIATTKELVKLVGNRYLINSDAVEAQVKQELNDASSSTTAYKK